MNGNKVFVSVLLLSFLQVCDRWAILTARKTCRTWFLDIRKIKKKTRLEQWGTEKSNLICFNWEVYSCNLSNSFQIEKIDFVTSCKSHDQWEIRQPQCQRMTSKWLWNKTKQSWDSRCVFLKYRLSLEMLSVSFYIFALKKNLILTLVCAQLLKWYVLHSEHRSK